MRGVAVVTVRAGPQPCLWGFHCGGTCPSMPLARPPVCKGWELAGTARSRLRARTLCPAWEVFHSGWTPQGSLARGWVEVESPTLARGPLLVWLCPAPSLAPRTLTSPNPPTSPPPGHSSGKGREPFFFKGTGFSCLTLPTIGP